MAKKMGSDFNRANQLKREDKWSEAIAAYQRAIDLNPSFSWYHYSLGEVLAKVGEFEPAVKAYERALKVNPLSANFHNSLAEVLIKLGQWDEAINASQKAISLQSNIAIYHQTLALAYEAKSDWGQALETWKKIILINPSHFRATEKVCWLQTNVAQDCIRQGDKLNKEGKIEDALDSYQQGLILNPQQPVLVYRTCGNNLITLSRFKDAETVFQQLIKLYPELPDGYDGYARLTHSLADWELALERWEEAILKFPDNINFQVQKGSALVKLSRFDEAEELFLILIEKYPNRPQGYNSYASLANYLGNWELALKRWGEGIVKFPDNINFQVQKGNALVKLSCFDEAEEFFLGLVEKYPNQLHGYSAYASLANQLGNWELALERWEEAIVKFPDNINFQVQKGNALINLSRFDEAEAVFIGLKEKYPNQPHGYEGYARLTHSLPDWELAVERWEEAIVKFPDNINFQVRKGNALINLSRFDEAEAVFIGLKEKYPNQPHGYEGYARLTQSLPDWELALERWEETIVKFPDNINFQVQKGNALIKLSRFNEAEAVFIELKEKHPNQPHGYEGYGRLAHNLSDWESALERWEEAIAKLPHYFNAYLQKGDVLKNLFRYEEAETWWEKVIAEYPYRYEGFSRSAFLASQLGNWEFAWQRFEQAIQKLPEHIPAYCEAARALKAMGRFGKAEEKFRQALQKSPNHLTALLQGGILASQQGNRELALERFEQIIKCHPQKSIDAYIRAATELKYLGRQEEAIAKYEQVLNLHCNPRLDCEVKLLSKSLTHIYELALLLDRLVTKPPDSVKYIISLARLTKKILFYGRYSPGDSIAKDAPSLLPKLKLLKKLFGPIIATQEDCTDRDCGVVDFGYDLFLLAIAQLLNDKYLRLFCFYFHTLIQQWQQDLLVLKNLNMAIQFLEKESQRLNSNEWERIELVPSTTLQSIDNLCFEGLSSSAEYVIARDEPLEKSKRETAVTFLPELMDEEKEFFEVPIRKFLSSLKLRSCQYIYIYIDVIWETPSAVSEGYIIPRHYAFQISQEFVNEFINDNSSSAKEHVAKHDSYEWIADPRKILQEIAINKKALNKYYEDDLVFSLPVYGYVWGAYQNYGHLLLDQIPSLILYQKLNLSCKIFVPHITDSHWDIFNALNIPKEKILVCSKHKFKHFIVAKYSYDIEMINFYRQLRCSIAVDSSDKFPECRVSRIYISRRYSYYRKMANEVEVEELMKSLGFSIVYLERLSFKETAVLMHHASIAVLPYGAAFASFLLSPPHTTIVCLYPPDICMDPRIEFQCAVGELKLYRLCGDQINGWSIDLDTDKDKIPGGWQINIDKLEKVITKILEG